MCKQLIALIVLLLFVPTLVLASNDADWLENTMYQSGKINVVIAVVGVLFVVLFVYIAAIDLKLRKMEKESKD